MRHLIFPGLVLLSFGGHGDSPRVVLAPANVEDCFYTTIEAVNIARKYSVPVILLTDGYLANGSEPWLVPDVATLPDISTTFAEPASGITERLPPAAAEAVRQSIATALGGEVAPAEIGEIGVFAIASPATSDRLARRSVSK